jgi:hypothetical protein
MKRLPALSAVCSLFLLVGTSAAQAPNVSQQQADLVLAVVREVQAQQAALADNQAKIDAKLAAIAEQLRVARIYSTRSGGKK